MTTVVLGAVWVLWPLIALMGGQGFAPLVGLCAILLAPVVLKSLRPRLYTFALLVFFIYAGFSSTWSPREIEFVSIDLAKMQIAVRSEIVRVGLQFVALGILIAAAQRLDDKAKSRVQSIAQVGLLVQLLILAVVAMFDQQILQALTPYIPETGEGVQNIARNCIIMSAAMAPLAVGLARGQTLASGFLRVSVVVGILIAVVLAQDVNSGPLAMAAASGAMLVVHFLPRIGFKLLGLGTASVIMSAPWVFGFITAGATYANATDSASYRAAIWHHVLDLIHEHPITGLGLGAFRTMREPIESGVFTGQMMIPNHPHNMLLQLWGETGAVGAGLLSLAILIASWRIPDQRKLGAAGLRGAAVVGAMVAITAVYFDLWNEWWWAVGGLLVVLAVSTPSTTPLKVSRKPEGRSITFGETPVDAQP